jgi:catechol 2,3-dioxygenase-like lactoylglutathione lyase family enzyme
MFKCATIKRRTIAVEPAARDANFRSEKLMTTPTPSLMGIHHIKFAVSDLDRSLHFYEAFLGAKRIPQADHRRTDDGSLYAYILEVPGLGCKLELRLNPKQAEKHRLFDALTIAVRDRQALEAWHAVLTEKNIHHSPIITAVQGWLIVVDDPDQNRVRLYTLERHGSELKPDEENEWLKD